MPSSVTVEGVKFICPPRSLDVVIVHLRWGVRDGPVLAGGLRRVQGLVRLVE